MDLVTIYMYQSTTIGSNHGCPKAIVILIGSKNQEVN